jgi:hypothetical protein
MPAPSYGVKYQAGWAARDGSMKGYLIIDKLNYVGTATDLLLSADSIAIRYTFDDWNNPILGLQCEFNIENNKDDFFELLPLLTAEEREYRVRVTVFDPSEYQLFEGFLNVNTITHKYLRFQNIRFSASSYLSKLENDHPVSVDTIQNMNFITLLQEILVGTGTYHHIRVNAKLHAEGDILEPAQTLFTKNGVSTEIFWTDLVDRKSCLEILKDILTSFDCYLYWWRGCWYIERYEDIWNESKDFVEYDIESDYTGIDDVGTVVEETSVIQDVHDLMFTDQSQTLSIIPGLKTIKISCDDQRYSSLSKTDLKDVIEITTGTPLPQFREWEVWEDSELSWINADAGKPKYNLKNSIHRLVPLPYTNAITNGIYTTFRATVDDTSTSLNIKFNYATNTATIENWGNPVGWKDVTFDFCWYLKDKDSEYYFIQTDNIWKMILGTPESCLQYVSKSGSDFDEASGSCEVSIAIPLGETTKIVNDISVGKLIGDLNLVLCIGVERIKIDDSTYRTTPQEVWFGDFEINTSGGNQDNVHEGKINTNFLNKKEISLLLYDAESYNYKNAILRGRNFQYRTERWGTDSGELHIVQKGVCWATTTGPTVDDDLTNDGTGTEAFTSNITGLIPATTYYVRAYYIDEDDVVTYGNERSFTTEDFRVGSFHAGGIIGYIFQPGDAGYVAGQTHGIIVAPQDVTMDRWCSLASGLTKTCGATGIIIGEGVTNTNLMLAETTNIGLFAAKKCGDYAEGGYTDWYLPSLDELKAIFNNKETIGGLTKGLYWSSTERQDPGGLFSSYWKYAYAVDFSKATTLLYDEWQKNNIMNIRPCRNF